MEKSFFLLSLKKYGYLFSIIGEILIIIQGLMFFFIMGEITSETITYVVLIPLPALLLIETIIFLSDSKKIPKIGGFFYFILLLLASASVYLGGGWFFGSIYLLIGGFMRVVAR
jgi:hypothetical protein